MVKVALIGCQKAEAAGYVPKDIVAVEGGGGVFAALGPCEFVGCLACGGCPGKQALTRAQSLKKIGADVIALSSSLATENSQGIICPYREKIYQQLDRQLSSVIVLDHTL